MRKQEFWGSGRGAASVPGKNTFISFHMDGAWWACFNVPWAQGVVWLYGVFYYLMGKKVYRYSKAPNPAWYPLIGKTYCFLKKKSVSCGGEGAKRICIKRESSSENPPLPLIVVSQCSDFCSGGSPFAEGKGSEKRICFNCFFPPSTEKSLNRAHETTLFCVVLPMILYLNKKKLGIVGSEINFAYNIYTVYVKYNII